MTLHHVLVTALLFVGATAQAPAPKQCKGMPVHKDLKVIDVFWMAFFCI